MSRLRRWTKRLGVVLLELFVVLTIASVAYNAVTAGDVKPATALYAGPFVHVDGKLVAYRRWGTRGTPIILLGGFIVPSSVWDGVGKRLARDHRVFALDLPPFGYTERRGPYTLRGWIDLVRAFETRLGLHHPILVGHSLGAAVVVAEALWHPADPKGIVLIDGDAISAGGAPSWVSKVLVGPWFTSAYRIATSSDWIFRRGLARAYPGHPSFTREFLEEWGATVQGAGNALCVAGDAAIRDPGLPPGATARGARACADAVGPPRHGRLGFRRTPICAGVASSLLLARERGAPLDASRAQCDRSQDRLVRAALTRAKR